MDVVVMSTRRAGRIVDAAAVVCLPLPGASAPDLPVPDEVSNSCSSGGLNGPVGDAITLRPPSRRLPRIATDEDVTGLALRVVARGVPCVRIPATHRRVAQGRTCLA